MWYALAPLAMMVLSPLILFYLAPIMDALAQFTIAEASRGLRHPDTPEDGEALQRLELAQSCASQQRLRTSTIFGVLGWVLIILGFFPMAFHYAYFDWPDKDLGVWPYYIPLVCIGGHVLGLAPRPSDRSAIQIIAYTLAGLWAVFGTGCAFVAWQLFSSPIHTYLFGLLWLVWCALNLGAAVAAGVAISTHVAVAPRLLLRSIWGIGRFLLISAGVSCAAILCVPLAIKDPLVLQDAYAPSATLCMISMTLIPLLMTPDRRTRIQGIVFRTTSRRVFNSSRVFTTSKSMEGVDRNENPRDAVEYKKPVVEPKTPFERQHYALAAALVETHHHLYMSRDRAIAVEAAKLQFASCKWTVQEHEPVERVNWSCCQRLLNELRNTRRDAEFGQIDAFVSHSSTDDERLKWIVLRRWATDFRREHGRWPRVWFDRVCGKDSKGNSRTPEDVVGTLPLMVAGCKKLLVLAGPGYPSRLWCLVEVLAFLWSQGGSEDAIEVLPLLRHRDETLEAELLRTCESLDVALSECLVHGERQLLLAAIESTFGTPEALNTQLRALLARRYRQGLPRVPEPKPPTDIHLVTALFGSDLLQLLILPYLPATDLLSMSLVCREWKQAVGAEARLWTLPIIELVFNHLHIADVSELEKHMLNDASVKALPQYFHWMLVREMSPGSAWVQCYYKQEVKLNLFYRGRNEVSASHLLYLEKMLELNEDLDDIINDLIHSKKVFVDIHENSLTRVTGCPETKIENLDDTLMLKYVDCRRLYCKAWAYMPEFLNIIYPFTAEGTDMIRIPNPQL